MNYMEKNGMRSNQEKLSAIEKDALSYELIKSDPFYDRRKNVLELIKNSRNPIDSGALRELLNVVWRYIVYTISKIRRVK